MNPEFIDWLADMKPSQWCMYGNAYAHESTYNDYFDEHHLPDQTFQDWLLECFNREIGDKHNGN